MCLILQSKILKIHFRVIYAAYVQLCPPEDEYLILETCREK